MAGNLLIGTNRREREMTPFKVYWGTSAPSNSLGSNGDIYIQYDNSSTFMYKKVDGAWVIPGGTDTSGITKEPTGFQDPANVIINYDSSSRTVTLTGSCTAYWRGVQVSALTSGWVSDPHTNTPGAYFLYYDGSSFVWSTTPWTFDVLHIAFINFTAIDKYGIRESHGLLQNQAHRISHLTIGTFLTSGGDLSNFTIGSTTLRNPDVSTTTLSDEDLSTTLPALTSSLYTKLYLTGAGATATYSVSTASIVPVSGNQPYYNQFTGGAWQQTLMSAGSYMAVWLIGVPVTSDSGSQSYRYLWVQGQSESNALATIQALGPKDVSLGTLSSSASEFVFFGKIIIRYSGGNWSITSTEKLTGTKIGQTASPTGAYLSTITTDSTLTGDGTVGNPLSVVFKGWETTNSQLFNLTSNTSSVVVTNFTFISGSKLRVERDGVTIYEGYGWTRNIGTNAIDFDNQILADATSPVVVFVGKYS